MPGSKHISRPVRHRVSTLSTTLRQGVAGGFLYGIAAAVIATWSGHPRPIAHVATYLALFAVTTLLIHAGLSALPRRRARPSSAVSIAAALTCAAEIFLQGHLRITFDEPWTSTNHLWLGGAAVGGGVLIWLAVHRYTARSADPSAPGLPPTSRTMLSAAVLLIAIPIGWVNVFGLPPVDIGDDGSSARAPKNVLLVTIDTLRADHLVQYGYQTDTSSALDRFGFVRFDQAFATANWTKPATASLLTGTYPSRHTAVDYESVLPPNALTITETARGLGMATGFCTANINASAAFGMDQGARFSTGDPTNPPDPLRGTTLGELLRLEFRRIDRASNLNRYAQAFLEEASDRRFFLYVHYNDPHTPYDPEGSCGPHDGRPFDGRVLLRPPVDGKITPSEREHMIARYDAEIRSAVDAVVALLESLEAEGVLDDTLVILTADHGEAFDDHGLWSHGNSTYDELVHIPLLVRPPGRTQPTTPLATDRTPPRAVAVDTPVSQVDIAPTILDYLDCRSPDSISGHSLRPLIEARSADPLRSVEGRAILTECHWNDQWGIRDEGYKVIVREETKPPSLEMYAPKSDPHELKNLIRSAEHRAIGERLVAEGTALRAALEAAGLPATTAEIDQDVERELRELGYVR